LSNTGSNHLDSKIGPRNKRHPLYASSAPDRECFCWADYTLLS
jgi:hypothetical protein